MQTIKQTNLTLIAGGNAPAVAAAAGVAVVTTTAAVIEAGKTFVNLGHDIGETIYNKANPDSGLGKMEYTKDDFKHPSWYVPRHEHPNNINGNSFHNSFGGF